MSRMLANANPKIDAVPADRNVREFVAICAKHCVPYGELNNLAGFMRALHDNKHLAMNFWSVVARMSERPAPEANGPDWMLAAIVEAVTGLPLEEVREAGPAHRLVVSRLASMLAGEDVQTPVEEMPAETVQKFDAASQRAKAARSPDPSDEPLLKPRSPARKARAARRSDRSAPGPVTNPAWLRDESLRIVLVPEDSEDERDIPIPLAGYADAARRGIISGRILGGGLLLMLLAGCAFWFTHHASSASAELERLSASIHTGYASAIAAWNGDSNQQPPAIQQPASSQNIQQPAPNQATPQPAPTLAAQQPPANASAINSAAANAATPALMRDRAPNEPDAGAPPRVKAQDPRAERAQKMAIVAAYNQQRNSAAVQPRRDNVSPASRDAGSATGASSAGSSGQVVVPAAVMDENLISSRVPVYPESAKASHIGGKVVMQAVVTRDGSVGRLHVVQGDPELRRAAMDAVSTWHYLPYLLNGQPVDVSTTIVVDFSSN
jgi:TonB family protein